ncbi:MAG: 16S rRNA (guanine(966)-N(2))-methyltransferase RsmD [Actinomycetota bacterium]
MRIIAGRFRGQRVEAPPSGTRPTSDRVREALFSALTARRDLEGAVVLDLYAGSGALGLEALSRGAARLVAVEKSRSVAAVLRRNAARLGVRVEVHTMPVATFLGRGEPVAADLVLLDPPYGLDAVDADLDTLARRGWVAPGGTVVVERSSRSPVPRFPDSWDEPTGRRYGETTLWLSRSAAQAD